MAKPKNPLVSLQAHGTIGGGLTYQGGKSAPSVRKKPTPAQPNTIHQLNYRNYYRDAIAMWNVLTPPEKEAWLALARPTRQTGLSLFLSQFLSLWPNIQRLYRLDGNIEDSSRRLMHGTNFGTTPAPGLVNTAMLFDGSDDWLSTPYFSAASLASHFTAFGFLRMGTRTIVDVIISHVSSVATGRQWALYIYLPGNLVYFVSSYTGNAWDGPSMISTTSLVQGTWYSWSLRKQDTRLSLSIDAAEEDSATLSAPLFTLTTPLTFGASLDPLDFLSGTLDHIILADSHFSDTVISYLNTLRRP